MNRFTDVLPSMVGTDGVLRGPAGDGRLAAVLRADVAGSAAAVLTTPGHDGDLEQVTGDVRALTGRHPVSLEAHVQAHPEALDHVRGG